MILFPLGRPLNLVRNRGSWNIIYFYEGYKLVPKHFFRHLGALWGPKRSYHENSQKIEDPEAISYVSRDYCARSRMQIAGSICLRIAAMCHAFHSQCRFYFNVETTLARRIQYHCHVVARSRCGCHGNFYGTRRQKSFIACKAQHKRTEPGFELNFFFVHSKQSTQDLLYILLCI